MQQERSRTATPGLNRAASLLPSAAYQTYRRVAQFVVLLVALAAILFSWFLSNVSILFLAVAVYMAVSLLTIRIDVDDRLMSLVDVVTHAGVGVVLLMHFYAVFYTDYDTTSILAETPASSGWVLLLCTLALFVSRPQYGRVWAAGYYLTFVGVGVSRIVGDAGAGDLAWSAYRPLLLQYLSTGALLLLLFVLSRLKHNRIQETLETEELRRRAHTDYLTGLPNRRKMTALIEQALERAQRYSQPFSVILFDIDHFKDVNDNHGHDVGDDVLRRIATIVAANVRKVDRVGRWGGEEFLIFTPEADLEHAIGYARRLNRLVAAYSHDPAGTVTASFGVTTYRAGDTLHDILKRADHALYRAKSLGRDKVIATNYLNTSPAYVSDRLVASRNRYT